MIMLLGRRSRLLVDLVTVGVAASSSSGAAISDAAKTSATWGFDVPVDFPIVFRDMNALDARDFSVDGFPCGAFLSPMSSGGGDSTRFRTLMTSTTSESFSGSLGAGFLWLFLGMTRSSWVNEFLWKTGGGVVV